MPCASLMPDPLRPCVVERQSHYRLRCRKPQVSQQKIVSDLAIISAGVYRHKIDAITAQDIQEGQNSYNVVNAWYFSMSDLNAGKEAGELKGTELSAVKQFLMSEVFLMELGLITQCRAPGSRSQRAFNECIRRLVEATGNR